MELAIDEEKRVVAESTKQMYDEYIRTGFSEKQAMQFLIADFMGVDFDE